MGDIIRLLDSVMPTHVVHHHTQTLAQQISPIPHSRRLLSMLALEVSSLIERIMNVHNNSEVIHELLIEHIGDKYYVSCSCPAGRKPVKFYQWKNAQNFGDAHMAWHNK
jgi:hypothetical protein